MVKLAGNTSKHAEQGCGGLQGKRIGTLDYFYDMTTADPGVLAVYNTTLMNLTQAGATSTAFLDARPQALPRKKCHRAGHMLYVLWLLLQL